MGARFRKLLLFIIATVTLIVVILLAAPLFVPAGLYKDQVIAKIERSTGRELEILGDIGLRFVPRVQLNMGNVHLSNPRDFDAAAQKDMIALQQLQLSLDFTDILQGRITIDTLNLVDPVIYLGRNARGKANWVLEPETSVSNEVAAFDKPAESSKFKTGLSLPNIEITNGTVVYQANPQAQPVSFNKLNARIKMPSLDDQLTFYADTRLNDKLPAKAHIRLNTPAKWLDGEESEYTVEITIDEKLLKLTSNGKADAVGDTSKGLSVKGDMRLAVTSLKELSAGLGYPMLQNTQEKGKISLRSMFNYESNQAKLLGTTLTIDETAISGSGSLNLSGARPKLTADISTADTLVLDRFLNKDKPSVSREQKVATGTESESKWSNEPLLADVSALKAMDADLKMNIGGVKAGKVTLGAMKIAALLNNGHLSATLPEFGFYGGTAATNLSIQAIGDDSLRISKNATVTNADLGKFLSDAYGFERLSGRGNLKLSVNTQGISELDFISRLGGSGTFSLQNGAIKGFNLANVVRDTQAIVKSVQDKTITADMGSTAPAAQTDFSSLNGSYTIAQGVITNPDLVLKAPLLDVAGSGTVDLPQQTVNYRLKPTIVGSIEGENRTQAIKGGLTIPVRVSGSFDQLKFTPDAENLIQEIAKDPKGTMENLEDNVRGLRDDVKSLFKGL